MIDHGKEADMQELSNIHQELNLDCNHVIKKHIYENTFQFISAVREKWSYCPKCGIKL
jgi:hypothetical protein